MQLFWENHSVLLLDVSVNEIKKDQWNVEKR